MRISREEIEGLVDVALGKKEADLVIRGGDLLSVYTGELLKGYSVAIKGEKIAYIGEDASHAIGADTEVIEAQGKVLIPGFIDGHYHFDSSVDSFLRYAMVCGTTTIIAETLDIGNTIGYEGVVALLENLRGQAIKFFALAPSAEPLLPSLEQGGLISEKEMEQLLDLEEVLGLGETIWTLALEGERHVLDNFSKVLTRGKTLEGHSSGAKGNKLVAYVACGISSCHEPIKIEEVLERLRLGLYTMIREGSIRQDLEPLSGVKDEGIDFRRLVLVTDGLSAQGLVEHGHMDYIVQKAINLGFDPVTAIQMATINPAEHFSLDHLIGGIAPGKYANILIIPDLSTIECQYVISKGRVVARDKELLVLPKESVYPDSVLKSVHLPRSLTPEDFNVQAQGRDGKATVRMIILISDLVTEETSATLPVVNGSIQMVPEQDLLKVSCIDRRDAPGAMFTAFIKGFGLKSGALASSFSWERTSPIIVVGADEADMAQAVNRIAELNGGLVLCQRGQILEELPLPIGGALSNCPQEEAAAKLRRITALTAKLGSSLSRPFFTLQTMPTVAIPYFRITRKGLLDLKEKKIVDLII